MGIEQIEGKLSRASWVVEAEVDEVVRQAGDGERQLVRLTVQRVLEGDVRSDELLVENPAAKALRVGAQGRFLLGEGSPHPVILQ